MRLSQAKRVFEKQIEDHGVTLSEIDPLLVWAAFRDFAHLPFKTPFAGLRFLAGVAAAARGDSFVVEIGRQFGNWEISDPLWARHQEPLSAYMVGVKLIYNPDEDLIPLIEQRFSHKSERTREFLGQIEALPVFKATFHKRRPIRYEITKFGRPFVSSRPNESLHGAAADEGVCDFLFKVEHWIRLWCYRAFSGP